MRISLFLVILLASVARCWADSDDAHVEFFENKIRPALVEHCYKCHSTEAKKLKGGLLVDSREAILKGGENGPALVPGNPEKSRLIEAIRYHDVDLQMPPRAKLPDAIITDLTKWVQDGAPWPTEKKSSSSKGKYTLDLAKRKQEHWCWQPLRLQNPPSVPGDPDASDIDRFLIAALRTKNLKASPNSDRRTLIRRLNFDLIGLPPTPAEVEAFVRDTDSKAMEKLVDRLLASPQFAERWARHWLDLVRYAETRGHEFDYTNPNAQQYRDYVIRAIDADVPYTQFVIEHFAGDLLPEPRKHPQEGYNESILGTGFWYMGEQLHSPVDICQDKADRADNMIDVMSKTFLALTVSCARCHDHKFDAISTKDYYALLGFLESSCYRQIPFDTLDANRQVARRLDKLRAEQRQPIQNALTEVSRPSVQRLAEYLLAARSILEPGSQRTIETVAKVTRLDAALLGRWVTVLRQSAKDEHDPLHLWSIATQDSRRDASNLLQGLLGKLEKREVESELVIDYGSCSPEQWRVDGPGFGPNPFQAGEPRFGTDPAHPLIRFAESTAADFDPIWDRLKAAPGVSIETGNAKIGARAGLGLFTPSFVIGPNRVYYLVQGAGQVYASIEGYVMLQGPLHGRSVKAIDTGARPRWVEHDLSVYPGRRVHLEFTPKPGSTLTVWKVVQAASPPPLHNEPTRLLWEALRSDAGTAETLAQGHQRLFEHMLKHLASDDLRKDPKNIRLANWLLQHADLFIDPSAQARLSAISAPLLKEQAKVVSEIRLITKLAPGILDLNPVDEHVYIRGTYKAPGELAPRRFLEALAGPEPIASKTGSGRFELARQIIDPAINPLLARVMVNRIWHHLLGRGLVASVDNFGVLGEAPSHPELLDYLADRFVKEGWSLKKMIKLIVLTQAYQRSSQPETEAHSVDPQNLLLHRANVRRLEGEAIRDAILLVSGRLDRQRFGPSIPVYLNTFQDGRGRPESGPLDGAGRRSIYLSVKRNFLSPLLLAFDTPTPFSTVGRRSVSNVPAQALILLNDPFVHSQAEVWARKTLAQPGDAAERVRSMYQQAFSRPPSEAELTACLAYCSAQSNELTAWSGLAHVLFNAKEFIYLP